MLISTPNVTATQGRETRRELEVARLLKEGFQYRGFYSNNSRGLPGTNLTIFVEDGNTSDFSSSLARFISKYGPENVASLDNDIWVRVKK